MTRQPLRGAIGIAFAVMLHAAFADQISVSEFNPPRIVQRPDSFDGCIARSVGRLERDVEQSVELKIATDGTLLKFSLPEGSPEWMNELSGCVLRQIQFAPADEEHSRVERSAYLPIKFRVRRPEQGASIFIENVGPLLTPPRMKRRAGDPDSCFPYEIRKRRVVSRFLVSMTIQSDGSVTDVTLPVGGESWYEATALCLLDQMSFIPGTRDGVPAAAQSTLPIVTKSEKGQVSRPQLRSTAEILEAAYRACYPPGLASRGSALYSFNVAANGRVTNPKLAKSSGDTRLDVIGACIMQKLEFSPLMQNGRAMRSTATWELPIRPPR